MLTKNYEKIFPSVDMASDFTNNRVEAIVSFLRDSKTPQTAKQIQAETGLRSIQYILDILIAYGFVDKEVRVEGTLTKTEKVRVYRGKDGNEVPHSVEINGYTYVLDTRHRYYNWKEKEITFPLRRAYYTWIG